MIKEKGAQFFLVAAFIIVSILLGLGAIYTSTLAPKEDTLLKDLSKEAGFEGGHIIDNGVFRAISQDEINKNIMNISEYYYKKNPESEIVVVYGTKIAFCSNRDGNNEIYVMNGNGTGQKNLTNNSAGDYYPAWSPNKQ